MPYLVWDPADPDATTGVGYDGNTYNKVVESVATLDELKTILGWSEEPFDEAYYKDHEFVAGDIAELSKRGVHAEYLQTLKDLKAEFRRTSIGRSRRLPRARVSSRCSPPSTCTSSRPITAACVPLRT